MSEHGENPDGASQYQSKAISVLRTKIVKNPHFHKQEMIC